MHPLLTRAQRVSTNQDSFTDQNCVSRMSRRFSLVLLMATLALMLLTEFS